MQVSELISAFNGRSVAYNVFSRIFIDIPDAKGDQFLLETLPHMLSIAETSGNDNMKKGAEMLKDLFADKDNFEKSQEDRAKDYTKLFILGKISIPVYESIYLSPTHLTKQEPWEQVKAFYAEHSFKRAENDRTMEDHIAMELQFIGLLSSKSAEHIENSNFDEAEKCLKAQFSFAEKHLTKWAYTVCDKAASGLKSLSTPFYPAYALMLKGFLECDMEFLKELAE